MPVSCNPYRKIYLLQFIIHSACIQSSTFCPHGVCSHCLTCHCFPSAPVARFLMGLHAGAQAEHTNVGEFLKLDTTKWTAIWPHWQQAAGSQRGASFAIVKTAFNADLLSHSLCARCCSRAAQVTANRLSRVRLLSQCPIPDKKWNEIIILIAAAGSCLSLSHSLSLCVCSLRFCSGIVWLQRAPTRGSNFQMLPLTKFFCCPPWAKTKNNLSALWHTHTQIESERQREGDTRNESLLPQRKLIFSVMWWEEKIKSPCLVF